MAEDLFRLSGLPPYVFAEVNAMKAAARRRGEDVIDLGHLGRDLARVALREAPRDDELLEATALLEARHLEDRVDALFLRLTDEAARVDDDHLRLVGLVDDGVTARSRDPEHDLAVDAVLGAAEADEMDRAILAVAISALDGARRAGAHDRAPSG